MRALRVPGQLRDLPGVKRREYFPGEFATLGLQAFDFAVQVERSIYVDPPQLINFRLKIDNWLFEI